MSNAKVLSLIYEAKIELDKSNDNASFKAQYHLLKAIESLSASSYRGHQTTTKRRLRLVK